MYSCHADIEVREETVVSLLSDESDNEGNKKKSEPSCKQGKRTPMKALKRPASNKPKQVAKQKKTGAEKEKTCSEKEKEGDKKEMREVPSNPKKNYLKNYYKKTGFASLRNNFSHGSQLFQFGKGYTKETLYEILDACIECLNDGTISEEDAQKFCVDKLPQDVE